MMEFAWFLSAPMKASVPAKTLSFGNFFDFVLCVAVGKVGRMRFPVIGVFALLLLCAAGTAGAQSCSGMSLGANASLNGFVPFPSTNAWNTNIASAPVDPDSATITAQGGFAGLNLHPDFGSSGYGIPYVVVDSSITPMVPIDVIDYANESDVVVAPYPSNAPIEGSPVDCSGWPDTYLGDSHVLVLDRAQCFLYETFNTNRCNGQWNASSETVWDMSNYESRPWGWTSADAAGLPIFPGLVRYDEIASGAINHALRFTLTQTKNDNNNGYFVPPASHASGNLWGSSNVMGMRIRLKASFDISGYSAVNQVILTAMKQYGMILADNGGSFYFQGVSDPRFSDDDLDNLKGISSSNFEVVLSTPEFPGYDSATAPTGATPVVNSFAASASNVTSGSAVTLTYSVSGDSYDYIDMFGPVPAGNGSVTIYPAATQTYTLNSTNAYGRTASTPITVTVPGSVVIPPVFTPLPGAYNAALAVTMSTPTSPSATIYYTTDGSTPTTSSAVFSISNPIIVSVSETIKAIAMATGYSNPSAVSSATYTMPLPVAATPAFSLAAGTYSSAQTVSISDGTTGAAIYYTTNGTTPTTSSSLYTGPVTVSATETIQAIAVASGYTNSSVASVTYTFEPRAASPLFSVAPGTYSTPLTVSISDATSGATIYYAVGSITPMTVLTKFTGPITVSATETLSAFAEASGYVNSAISTITYTFEPRAATPVYSLASGTYTGPQTVTISDSTAGATIYYAIGSITPMTVLKKYTGPITVSASETISAFGEASGNINSAIAMATYTISPH
jgi:hypothetical protein